MQLLVFMVQRRRDVKVAQHVARGLLRGHICTVLPHMGTQPLQQGERALHALVAGLQHGKGLLEPDGGRIETGQGRGSSHGCGYPKCTGCPCRSKGM